MRIKKAFDQRLSKEEYVLSEAHHESSFYVEAGELKGELFGPRDYFVEIFKADGSWIVEIRCINTFIEEPRDLVMRGVISGQQVAWEKPKAVTSTR